MAAHSRCTYIPGVRFGGITYVERDLLSKRCLKCIEREEPCGVYSGTCESTAAAVQRRSYTFGNKIVDDRIGVLDVVVEFLDEQFAPRTLDIWLSIEWTLFRNRRPL